MIGVNSLKARLRDSETNPCLKEADLSTKCLELNHYVKEKCEAAFENYNNCRSFWSTIVRQRKQAHIKPALPGNKERQIIKQEWASGKKIISAPVENEEQ